MNENSDVEEWIYLKNGFIIKFLYENVPTFQLIKSKDSGKYKHRLNSLLDFIIMFDERILLSEETDEINISLSQKKKKENYSYNDDFSLYLNLNFYEGTYIKKEKARRYRLKYFISNIVFKYIDYLLENDFEELFTQYKINKNAYENTYYKGVKFNKFKFFSNEDLDYEQFYLTKDNQISNENTNKFLKNKVDYNEISEIAIVKMTNSRKYIRTFYDYSERKTNEFEKIGKTYTFDIEKNYKFRFKKNESKSALKKYKHTKIDIDIPALIASLKQLTKNNQLLWIIKIINFMKYYRNNDNFILYDSSSFRWQSNSSLNYGINLQSYSSKLRKIIFQGNYDYDIQAGAPTLLYQYMKKVSKEQIKLIYLENYIKDRESIRKLCAKKLAKNDNEFEKKYVQIKEVITACLYGGQITNSHSQIELPLIERELLLNEVDEFKNLTNDIADLFKYYKKYIQNEFINKGKKIIKMPNGNIELFEKTEDGKLKQRNLKSVVTSIYFSLESQILELMYNRYKDDILLLIHDGFIAKMNIEIVELENMVKKELGYEVRYEKDYL